MTGRSTLSEPSAVNGPKSRFWQDVAWLASGNVIAQGIAVACMPFLTRLYDPTAFALQSLFLQALGFASIVQTMRLEYFVQLPKEDGEAETLVGLVVALGCACCAVMILIIALFGERISAAIELPEIAEWLIWIPITGLVCGIAIALEHYRQRQGKFRLTGRAEIVSKTAYLGTALSGSLFSGAGGLMLATGFGTLAKTLVLVLTGNRDDWVSARRALRFPAWSAARSVLLKYSRLSRTTVVSHLLQNTGGLIPILCVTWQFGAAKLGQFALVNSTIALPASLIGASIGKVYYQRASASWARGESIKELWVSTFSRLLIMGVPLFAGIAALSPWAYPFVFGADWKLAGTIAVFMAVPSALSFLSSPLDRGAIIAGASRYILVWNTGRVVGACAVALLSLSMDLSFLAFVGLHCVQMTIVYLTDLAYNRYLAFRGPSCS
jgi:O-antigen/teichoic acid export membrane protein